LLSNAVKFSKHGDTVKVEILVYDLLEDSDKVELEIKVEDSGLGIYPEDLKNLF
jgi:signal transduction histidine kinase